MCGIVGFVGRESAAGVVLESLKRLEYRGYDSAGLATMDNGQLWCKKGVGKLAEVQAKHSMDLLPGNTGIGHVRWATHGAVTSINAHPHLDCRGEVAIVHNGIIENYQELRQQLKEEGHELVSETDTEVIAHLIEHCLADGCSLEHAVLGTIRKLYGSYAFLAISSREPGKIVAARKDSPMVVGVGNGQNFLASDILSFIDRTNQAIFVEDNEVVVLTEDGVTVLDRTGKRVDRKPTELQWNHEEASKLGHEFFMHKEIQEQPQMMLRALEQDREFIVEVGMDILRAKQVVITACGTSRYAALIGRYLFSKLAGKFCDVIMASEFHYFADSVDKNTLVIAVSQSGETADVMEGVKRAKANGAQILSIVNRAGSLLDRISDKSIYLHCGPEICVAATKSFINQLVVFYLLAFAMANRLLEAIDQISSIAQEIDRNIKLNGSGISELAQRTKDCNDYYYIARGINFAIAAEGALKLKEISYIHAEGMPGGELKHGTLALIEEGTPVVAICPRDYTFEETLSNAAEAKARGAFIVGVSDERNEIYNHWVPIPKVKEIYYPLVSVVPLQLIAYYLALSRGTDPDRPRNLAKSVTVK